MNTRFFGSLIFFGLASGLFAEPELKSIFNGKDLTGWKAPKGKFKYVCSLIEGEMEELYDLTRDPDELNNLALKPRFDETLALYRVMATKELNRTKAPFAGNLPKPSTEH